ncbi:CHRD domain-containing protein (plasmid) [Haladaptatus sp. SPP-AMP-3]|uniref:CHRD domain-containing protein n=1 Tax=Haladaptatus sp. SPP-AMP-3 TaxID=3121295 RepID=UPI003C2B7C43
MPDTDKRETLKLLSLGAVALSGVGAGVVAGNDDTDSDSNSGSDAEQQPPTELFSTGVLTGENEVPPNESDGRGVAVFQWTTDGELEYGLLAFGLDASVTKAHIHTGESGENGPHVVNLIDGSGTEEQYLFGTSVVATGTISDDDLVGPYEGSSLDDLATEMTAGKTYVNVHSKAYPDGEIRDQIYPVGAVDVGFETTIDAGSDEEASALPSLDVNISGTECR